MTVRSRSLLSRREWASLCLSGVAASAMAPWLPALAADSVNDPQRRRSCILLWMSGGPSQTDTFDLKTGHASGGPFQPIETSVPGLKISEHLPGISRWMEHLVPIRSMTTKEGDHARATYVMRTGYANQGPVRYPTMGSLLSHELSTGTSELPDYVSIAPARFLNPAAFEPGFLGPGRAPLVIGGQNGPGNGGAFNDRQLSVANMALPDGIDARRADARMALLYGQEDDFAAVRPDIPVASHRTGYEQAVKLMRSEASKAFRLDDEPAALRDAYGRNLFGQGCLLARRLIERGVPFVEVSLNGAAGEGAIGWDTHANNFEALKVLCGVLDPAWATLMSDLKQRGLLDSTLIVWMGEFGRTPKINENAGRDHFPNAWTTVLGGGGIKGGQFVGRTSDDGMTVADRPVTQADLMATLCKALGLDPLKQNMSNVGRPIRLADPDAKPVREVLA